MYDNPCHQCPLWGTQCRTYRMDDAQDDREAGLLAEMQARGARPIMVVLPYPRENSDLTGIPLQDDDGRFLRLFLDRLENPWVVTHAVRCHPGAATKDKQTAASDLCSQLFLTESVRQHKPAVIVALGALAMTAVLGARTPRTLTEGMRGPIKLEDGTWVLVAKDPINEITGKDRLGDSYRRVFTEAERLANGTYSDVHVNWKIIRTEQDALNVLPFQPSPSVSLDVETAVCDIDADRKTIWHPGAALLSVSLTYRVGDKQYDTYVLLPPAISGSVLRQAVLPYHLVGHNLKYDTQAVKRFCGEDLLLALQRKGGGWSDTFLRSVLRDLGGIDNGLKKLAVKHFGAMPWNHKVLEQVRLANERIREDNKRITKENRTRAKQGLPPLEKATLSATYGDVQEEDLAEYNAHDTHYTARLHHEVFTEWEEQDKRTPADLLLERATLALALTECRGIPVDPERVQAVVSATEAKLDKITKLLLRTPEIARCPKEFNLKSSPFVQALKESTGTPTVRIDRKTGKPKMDKAALQELAGIYPKIPADRRTRLNWLWYYIYWGRQHRDLLSRGLKALSQYPVFEGDLGWRIHTTYKLGKSVADSSDDDTGGGAETGRLASADPNLQNLKKDPVFRSCFRAMPGWTFAELDYDRIELVVLAWLSQSKKMIDALRNGVDLHELTARMVFHIPEDDPVPEHLRDLGKRANFAVVYGEGPETFADRNGIEVAEAYEIFAKFWTSYPEILAFYNSVDKVAEAGEPVYTAFGRKRYFTITGNSELDAHTKREWRNFVVQSVASDITLWKLCDVYDWMIAEGYEKMSNLFHPINVVHDSIWPEIKKSELAYILPILTRIMTDIKTLPIPFDLELGVSCATGDTLGCMTKHKTLADAMA